MHLNILASGAVLILLAGCVSAEDLRAGDQQRCAGYGFQPGTDAFARCMMHTDQQRAAREEAQKDRDAGMKALSQQRNGNPAYPVCSAAMINAELDTYTNTWYGPNCREQ